MFTSFPYRHLTRGLTLTIVGKFKDGDDTVLDPLCQMLIILKDMDKVKGGAMKFATRLLALRACPEAVPHLPSVYVPFPFSSPS